MINRINSLVGLRTLQTQSRKIEGQFAKLAAGQRIVRAADDAAGLALSERLRSLLASSGQGIRNLSDGISSTQIAEGALAETSGLLSRMRALLIQGSNGTLGDSERGVIQQEFDSLVAEVSRISKSTEFNGRPLLDGSVSGPGAMHFVSGSGSGSEDVALSVDDQSAAGLGVDGLDASDLASLAAIDSAVSQVSATRASVGTTESRLASQIRSLQSSTEQTVAAESRIRDADFASEVSSLNKELMLRSAAIAVRAQSQLQAGLVTKLLA